MRHISPFLHRATLSVSAEQVAPGDAVMLQWHVVGVGANIASVHVASGSADSPLMIESVPAQSSREVIFMHPGTFSFTLTATFGDGEKCRRYVRVDVRD